MKKLLNNKKFIFSVIAIIFLWGVALRAVEVINANFIFNFDVGRDLLIARSIVEEHKWTLIGAEIGSGSAGINGIFQGPGYYYLLALSYLLSGGNPYGALVMMFIFGVASLIAVYWATKKIFGRNTAILILFLTGVSPLIASQSRFIWAPHPATLLIVLYFYFVYQIAKKPRLYAPAAVLAAVFTYHFELAMTVPMVLAAIMAIPIVYRIKDIKAYGLSLGVLIVGILPALFFEMRHGWMAVRSILSYTSPQGAVGSDVWILRIRDHAMSYLDGAINSFPTEHGFMPYRANVALIIGLLVALIILAWKTKDMIVRKYFQFLLILTSVTYVVLLLLNNTVWDYYLIHLHFVYIFIFAYVFVRAIQKKQILIWALLGIFLLSHAWSSVLRMKSDYTYDLFDFGGPEKIRGKEAAVDYVYHDAAGKPFSEFTFMAPIYTYPYDYLFQTYGKKKYGYEPGNVKKGLVYLIIEPDQSKPWTYKGWLETVIVSGKILQTTTLPSGQIVQKRLFP